MDENHLIGGLLGTIISASGAAISVNDVQLVISIIATILGLLITITTSVVLPLIKQVRKIKEDGKITNEEVQETVEVINNGLKEVKEEIDKESKKHGN